MNEINYLFLTLLVFRHPSYGEATNFRIRKPKQEWASRSLHEGFLNWQSVWFDHVTAKYTWLSAFPMKPTTPLSNQCGWQCFDLVSSITPLNHCQKVKFRLAKGSRLNWAQDTNLSLDGGSAWRNNFWAFYWFFKTWPFVTFEKGNALSCWNQCLGTTLRQL